MYCFETPLRHIAPQRLVASCDSHAPCRARLLKCRRLRAILRVICAEATTKKEARTRTQMAMTSARSVDLADAMPDSETWPPTTLTDRLLDVLLDTHGVCAAFIVNDFGELLGVRFAPDGPPRSAFAGALEAAAGLRVAVSSGLET